MMRVSVPGTLCRQICPEFAGDKSPEESLRRIREATREMIHAAIRDGLDPAPVAIAADPGATFTLSFPGAEALSIRTLAFKRGVREGEIARGLLQASILRGGVTPSAEQDIQQCALTPWLLVDGKQPNAPQTEFFRDVSDALQNEAVGLVEAATGVGKTIAMIVAAAETINGTGTRAVITVPTIQLLRQFLLQHDRLATIKDSFPRRRSILGRSEFVSAADLQALLSDGAYSGDPAPILDWIREGCPPAGDAASLIRLPALAASLLDIAPDLPMDAVRLVTRTNEEDPGELAYMSQFMRDETPQDGEIIYCTHAMLARDIWQRMVAARHGDEGKSVLATSSRKLKSALADDTPEARARAGEILMQRTNQLADSVLGEDSGHLPPWQYLLVDEAHLLEENVSNALSAQLSLTSYLRQLKELHAHGGLPASCVEQVTHCMAELQKIETRASDVVDLSDKTDTARPYVTKQLEITVSAVQRGLKSKRKALTSTGAKNLAFHVEMATGIIARAAAGSRYNVSRLQFSPVRSWPQITVGRKSIDAELRFLWRTARAAACISATLYTRRLDSDSSNFARSVLAIPKERAREYPPVRPSWLYECVTGLSIPDSNRISGRAWLLPPSNRDRQNESRYRTMESAWLDDVALAVRKVRDSAAGGTLVLCTSYDMVRGIASRLGLTVPEKVVASPTHSISQQLVQFVEFGHAGRKPVWLALGTAWTGLDINGERFGIANPADDNLLTDLVIPRIPFRLNRSTTHAARSERSDSIMWELLDTAQRFKQGLGRLVRRRGLPKNRRIFVLDNRFNDPAFAGLTSILKPMLHAYPMQPYQPSE